MEISLPVKGTKKDAFLHGLSMKLWYVTSGSLSDYIHACGHALYVSAAEIMPYLWLHLCDF